MSPADQCALGVQSGVGSATAMAFKSSLVESRSSNRRYPIMSRAARPARSVVPHSGHFVRCAVAAREKRNLQLGQQARVMVESLS
jgi:hypothetical protein